MDAKRVDDKGQAVSDEIVVTSAPGKVILFGEHSVNLGHVALAAAIDRRLTCRVRYRGDDRYSLTVDSQFEERPIQELPVFRRQIDDLRQRQAISQIQHIAATDFMASTRYVLSQMAEGLRAGVDVEWRSELPVGAGLGSGAAASAAVTLAISHLTGMQKSRSEIAELAHSGDVIAHGGVASGLDSSASTLGGVIRYSLSRGAEPVTAHTRLRLAVADTHIRASTAQVNSSVRFMLEREPRLRSVLEDIGSLTEPALHALANNDLEQLGQLMNRNHLLLREIGVSSPEIERLWDAAQGAGALGAKLSGSGRGGVVIALCREEQESQVADAISQAGGAPLIIWAGADGVCKEPATIWH